MALRQSLLWLLLFCLAGVFPAHLQAASLPQNAGEDIKFEPISLEQGLSQSVVTCILQDRDGFMWFGTQDGLNRYDGYSFTVYKPLPDQNSLAHNYIMTMIEASDGALWIGTSGGGLDRFDRALGTFTHYAHDPHNHHSLSHSVVRVVYEDHAGVLWVGTDAGLNQFDRTTEQWQRYVHNPKDPYSLSHNRIRAIFEDREGELWIGTDGGLNRLDRNTGQVHRYVHDPNDPYSLSGNGVRVIFEDTAERLWIGTDGGLNVFDRANQHFTHYQNRLYDVEGLTSNAIRAIYEEHEGGLWIGTLNGLARFDAETGIFSNYTHDPTNPQSLSNNWVLSIYQDREGVLWIGTYGGGINKVDRTAKYFAHYRGKSSQPISTGMNYVWAIYQDQAGILWIGTNGGGLKHFDRRTNTIEAYRHDPYDPHSLSHDAVHEIYEDRTGALWIGTSGGLDRLDRMTGHFDHYRTIPEDPQSLSHNTVRVIRQDRNGALWVGTSGGLNQFDPETGKFTRYLANSREPYHLRDNVIRDIYEDSNGDLWIATSIGLERFDRRTGRFFQYETDVRMTSGVSYHPVMSIYEDWAARLWVGTYGSGLGSLNRTTGEFSYYTVQDGLPNDVVYGVLGDGKYLWLSTNKGISRFNPQTKTFRNYDQRDGLQSDEFNAGAYYQAADGELFFGGINGFNAFYPGEVQHNRSVPPIVLTNLMQNGVPLVIDGALENVQAVTLRWPINFFEFEFAALSYMQPDKNQYAYMLENFDKDWHYIGNRRFGRYTNLPGGKYTLRLKGSNSDGVWNETGVAIRITVIPPFWQTPIFLVTLAFFAVLMVVGGYRWRVRTIAARNRDLEMLVDQRTAALEQHTREIERRRQELEALYRADAELHRYLSLDQVLQALVDIAVDILEADKSALLIWDEDRTHLSVRVARGYHVDALQHMVFAADEGIVGLVGSTGEPVVVPDTRLDMRIAKPDLIVVPEGIRSLMQVPIKIGGEVFGVFSADYVQARTFGEDEKRLFVALAQRAALAIDTAQLYEQSQTLVVMEERNRLARDLHDAVTQTLFSASLIAEVLPSLWDVDRAEGQRLLRELRQMSRGAQAEMRNLLLELRPTALVEAELGDLLCQLGEALMGREGIVVNVNIAGECALSDEVHIAFYRIAQEALNNIAKHAHARQVDVTLSALSDGSVLLRIVDDGCGFVLEQVPKGADQTSTVMQYTFSDQQSVSVDVRSTSSIPLPPSSNHLGLTIMRERAEAVGATFVVQSAPGEGTQISVQYIPDQQGQVQLCLAPMSIGDTS